MENHMRYNKPAVLSCLMASKSVLGIPKFAALPDSKPMGDQSQCTAAAYEADE